MQRLIVVRGCKRKLHFIYTISWISCIKVKTIREMRCHRYIAAVTQLDES